MITVTNQEILDAFQEILEGKTVNETSKSIIREVRDIIETTSCQTKSLSGVISSLMVRAELADKGKVCG